MQNPDNNFAEWQWKFISLKKMRWVCRRRSGLDSMFDRSNICNCRVHSRRWSREINLNYGANRLMRHAWQMWRHQGSDVASRSNPAKMHRFHNSMLNANPTWDKSEMIAQLLNMYRSLSLIVAGNIRSTEKRMQLMRYTLACRCIWLLNWDDYPTTREISWPSPARHTLIVV